MANTTVKQPRDSKPLKFYMQDDENTMLYNPSTMSSNKFFGQWNKVLTMSNRLNHELQDKYLHHYQSYAKAQREIGTVTTCFDHCVQEVETGAGLSSDEKNCMRECYLKRTSAREDMNMLMGTYLAKSNLKSKRDEMV